MKPKKNPDSELKKDFPIYFTLGLTMVLSLVYVALESNIEYYPNRYSSQVKPQNTSIENLQNELIEEVPITFQLNPPPPVIPVVEEIPFVGCDLPIPLDTTNGIISCGALDVDQIVFQEKEEEVITCNWLLAEHAPIFPGCEDEIDKRACFQEMVREHIQRNFKYPKSALDISLQGTVLTQFTIQTDGSIGDIKIRGAYKILESEAERIISKLPQMTPGKQNGNPVKVPFAIPIVFKLQ